MANKSKPLKARRKLEVTWTIIGEEFHDSWPTREEAENWAAANPPEGKWRIVKMVEHDPGAARIVRAARRLIFTLNDRPCTNEAERKLLFAVEAYEKRRKRAT